MSRDAHASLPSPRRVEGGNTWRYWFFYFIVNVFSLEIPPPPPPLLSSTHVVPCFHQRGLFFFLRKFLYREEGSSRRGNEYVPDLTEWVGGGRFWDCKRKEKRERDTYVCEKCNVPLRGYRSCEICNGKGGEGNKGYP